MHTSSLQSETKRAAFLRPSFRRRGFPALPADAAVDWRSVVVTVVVVSIFVVSIFVVSIFMVVALAVVTSAFQTHGGMFRTRFNPITLVKLRLQMLP